MLWLIIGLLIGWAVADYRHSRYEDKLENKIKALRAGSGRWQQ